MALGGFGLFNVDVSDELATLADTGLTARGDVAADCPGGPVGGDGFATACDAPDFKMVGVRGFGAPSSWITTRWCF